MKLTVQSCNTEEQIVSVNPKCFNFELVKVFGSRKLPCICKVVFDNKIEEGFIQIPEIIIKNINVKDHTVTIKPEDKIPFAKSIQIVPVKPTKDSQKIVTDFFHKNTRILKNRDSFTIEGVGFQVISCDPRTNALVNSDTLVHVLDRPLLKENEPYGIENIGSNQNIVSQLSSIIDVSLMNNDLLFKVGIDQPYKGVLLYGPPGSGKTFIVKCIAEEYNLYIKKLDGNELKLKSGVDLLTHGYNECLLNTPSILFIDDLDLLTKDDHSLFKLMNIFNNIKEKVLIIATSNSLHSIDSSFYDYGKFEKFIEIKHPDEKDRRLAIQSIASKMKINSDVNLEKIIEMTKGFTNKELIQVFKEAAVSSIRNHLSDLNYSLEVRNNDLIEAIRNHIAIYRKDSHKLFWKDIGGYNQIKKELSEIIQNHPYLKKPFDSILIFGANGTGKALFSKVFTSEFVGNYINIPVNELYGLSENGMKNLITKQLVETDTVNVFHIHLIENLKEHMRTLFKCVSKIMLKTNTYFIATSAKPSFIINLEFFSKIIYVPLPDLETREDIFKLSFNNYTLKTDIDLKYLAQITDGYTGENITSVCKSVIKEATLEMIKEKLNRKNEEEEEDFILIQRKHFENAFKRIRKYYQNQEIEEYLKFAQYIEKSNYKMGWPDTVVKVHSEINENQ